VVQIHRLALGAGWVGIDEDEIIGQAALGEGVGK
jgi:hypothetical protein